MKRWLILLAAMIVWTLLPTALSAANGLGGLAGKIKEKASERKSDKKDSDNSRPAMAAYTGPKKRLAIMDMEVKVSATTASEPTTTGGSVTTTTVYIPPPTDFGTGLTEMLTTALVNSGRFVLLERKAIADIQAEHALGASGAVDPESATKAGSLIGAQALIRGAVTEYTYKRSSTGGSASFLKGVGVASSKAEAAVVLDIRLYDAATGQIIDSVKAEGRAKSSAAAVNIDKEELKMSASSFSQSPLGQATRQAIDRAVAFIVERMEKVPWEGRVAEIETETDGGPITIYINAGSEMGLKEGDELEILRPGRDIKDPETKVIIGRTKDKRLGRCCIVSLTKNLAIAELREGEGCQKNDVVRLVESERKKPEGQSQPTNAGQNQKSQ